MKIFLVISSIGFYSYKIISIWLSCEMIVYYPVTVVFFLFNFNCITVCMVLIKILLTYLLINVVEYWRHRFFMLAYSLDTL